MEERLQYAYDVLAGNPTRTNRNTFRRFVAAAQVIEDALTHPRFADLIANADYIDFIGHVRNCADSLDGTDSLPDLALMEGAARYGRAVLTRLGPVPEPEVTLESLAAEIEAIKARLDGGGL